MGALALATLLFAAVLLASMVSVHAGVSVAILELLGGVVLGNAFGAEPQEWLVFIASFAGVVLTFLAGAEVDVPLLRREWRPSAVIGLVSFGAPFLAAMAAAYWLLGWSGEASAIAGIALSTTSLAVVYAVLVETGLNRERFGKLLMSATFVTDFATASALSIIFIRPNPWFAAFLAASIGLIVLVPRIAPAFFRRYGGRVIEPEIKLVFAALLLLMWLGDRSGGQAVLPAFVLGLVMSGHYASHRQEQERLRVVAFAFLTPLFFVRGGMAVSLSAVWTGLGALAVLCAAKLAGADLARAGEALAVLQAQPGRGARLVVGANGGHIAIIDESYNANPASMRAALATLGLTPRTEFKRRVAVLGDMLELGGEGPRLHAELAEFIAGAGVDVVFACGELMGSLFEALPVSRRGAYAKSAEELRPLLTDAVGAGDVIMVKGSLGSRMAPLVEALKQRFAGNVPA